MFITNNNNVLCQASKNNNNIDMFINKEVDLNSSHNIILNKKRKISKKENVINYKNNKNNMSEYATDNIYSSDSGSSYSSSSNFSSSSNSSSNFSSSSNSISFKKRVDKFTDKKNDNCINERANYYKSHNSNIFNSLHNTHQFFDSNDSNDTSNNDYNTYDFNSDDSNSTDDSSNYSDSSLTKSTILNNKNNNKRSKTGNSDLQEEINDLKKDTINNSYSLDHIQLALETLNELRCDFPKIKISELIKKFEKELFNLNKLKSTPGIKIIDNLFIKYKSAYNKVYKMLKKEYGKKKERLNIKLWTTQEINKRKQYTNKEENDYMYPMLYSQALPNTFVSMAEWGGVVHPVKDQELINEFNTLYKQDSGEKSGTDYFKELNTIKKKEYISKLKDIKKIDGTLDNKPNMVKIIECDTTNNNKSILLSKINNFENLKGSSENCKLKNWISKIMMVPFGKYVSPPVSKLDGTNKIKEYLHTVRKNLDQDIYGHDDTKKQLIKILAHTISNSSEGGNIFALQGPPGIGKTALIQDGVSKALGRPFTFISLGGATDACFLEGHDYTYEGSNCGRIVDILHKAGCMNPVIYFDELDKVSETAKGEEIINILMHITDITQNSHFNDKYFGGIDFDLSKAIIIFSFNDEYKISRILRDRMKIIRIKGYKMIDKVNIARDYLLPKLLKQIGLDIEVYFNDQILEYITDTYTNEGGVRKLKELLNDILLEINLRKLEDNTILGEKINNKLIISKKMIDEDLLKTKHKIEHISINSQPYIGQVNGLWADEYGIGGLVPIECCWIPSTDKLKLELTGMQGKVMQESMSVARTIAWKILPNKIKDFLNNKWRKSFDFGIHVHCPDGATPKDGPSAGGAITTCLISLLSEIPVNNKIAMTGEINLKGQITKIGGLEEKIFGAKKAGAEIVLCPKENLKDLEEIRVKFPNLFDTNFTAKTVNTIWEILDHVLLNKLDYQKF